jgi:hypothetical protein
MTVIRSTNRSTQRGCEAAIGPLNWEWSSRLGLTWFDVLRLGGWPQVKRCVPTFVLAG